MYFRAVLSSKRSNLVVAPIPISLGCPGHGTFQLKIGELHTIKQACLLCFTLLCFCVPSFKNLIFAFSMLQSTQSLPGTARRSVVFWSQPRSWPAGGTDVEREKRGQKKIKSIKTKKSNEWGKDVWWYEGQCSCEKALLELHLSSTFLGGNQCWTNTHVNTMASIINTKNGSRESTCALQRCNRSIKYWYLVGISRGENFCYPRVIILSWHHIKPWWY